MLILLYCLTDTCTSKGKEVFKTLQNTEMTATFVVGNQFRLLTTFFFANFSIYKTFCLKTTCYFNVNFCRVLHFQQDNTLVRFRFYGETHCI